MEALLKTTNDNENLAEHHSDRVRQSNYTVPLGLGTYKEDSLLKNSSNYVLGICY